MKYLLIPLSLVLVTSPVYNVFGQEATVDINQGKINIATPGSTVKIDGSGIRINALSNSSSVDLQDNSTEDTGTNDKEPGDNDKTDSPKKSLKSLVVIQMR